MQVLYSAIEEFLFLLLMSLLALGWLFETKISVFHVSKVFEFEKAFLLCASQFQLQAFCPGKPGHLLHN